MRELIGNVAQTATRAGGSSLRGAASTVARCTADLGFAEWLDLAAKDVQGSGPDATRRHADRDADAPASPPGRAGGAMEDRAGATRGTAASTAGEPAGGAESSTGDQEETEGDPQAGSDTSVAAAAVAAAAQQSPGGADTAAGNTATPMEASAEDVSASATRGLDTPFWEPTEEHAGAGAEAHTDAAGGDGGALSPAGDNVSSMPTGTPPPVLELSRSLDLLDPHELLDRELAVDTRADGVLEKLQQALTAGAAQQPAAPAADVVMPQVVRGLASLVRNGAAELRLQLQPQDLGEIEMRVRITEGIVRGEMMVQNPDVKQLMDANMDRLRTALAEEGLDLAGFDVGVDVDGRFTDARGREQERGAQSRSPAARAAAEGGERQQAQVAAAAIPRSDSAVDFTI